MPDVSHSDGPKAESEATLRRDLAACYHLFHRMGWTEQIFNHITVRLPGERTHFLINPWGLWYDEVTASNLVKIDTEAKLVEPSEHGVNPAGAIIHCAIHAARPDAHCVMHLHTTTGIAVACQADGLSHDNFYGAQLYGRVAYHEFEGITLHAEEQPRLIASLGDKQVMILRNHGLLTLAPSIAEAFWLMWTLQRACDVQCASQALAGGKVPIPTAVAERSAHDAAHFDPDRNTPRLMFEAWRRRLDQDGAAYAR
jgi:ribulose-5-phosphate 4-epimerase/fuculose-1-phosphate aldolase